MVVDPAEGRVTMAWLVPSAKFAALVPTPTGQSHRDPREGGGALAVDVFRQPGTEDVRGQGVIGRGE